MSAPAAKAFSLPVMTMQPMPSSASKASSAAPSLVHQASFSALSCLGRLSVIRAVRRRACRHAGLRSAVRLLNDLCGPAAEGLAIRMERATSAELLAPLLDQAIQMVASLRGRQAALEYGTRIKGA
jgi:hypothetical protein